MVKRAKTEGPPKRLHESRTLSAKLMQARWRISTETGEFPLGEGVRNRERERERVLI